jgi:hypothetical protein
MMSDGRVIDAHVHVGQGREKQLTVEELLGEMDRWGVDRAVICPVDEEIVVENRAGNDRILAAVRAHPDRLVGFAVANPWYGEAAVEELRRAIGEGLRGLKLKSSVQGFRLSDEWIDPVVAVAAESQLPVYCHTGTGNYAMPLQLAELARRFPDAPFIMGHGGAGGDYNYYFDVIPAMELESNIYFETSTQTPAGVRRYLGGHLEWAERFIFGSNLPAASFRYELTKMASALEGQDAEVKTGVMGGNIARLLEEVRA